MYLSPDISQIITQDTTLYAKWRKQRYTVTFVLESDATLIPRSSASESTSKDVSANTTTFSDDSDYEPLENPLTSDQILAPSGFAEMWSDATSMYESMYQNWHFQPIATSREYDQDGILRPTQVFLGISMHDEDTFT